MSHDLDPAPDSDEAPCDGVRREVVLDAAPDDVWAQMAEAEGLRGWLADEIDLEIREGASGTVREDGEERPVRVEEVVPGRRLGLVWGADPETLVEITVDRVEDAERPRTRVVVVEVPTRTLRLVAPAAERVLAGVPGGGGAPTALALAGRA